MSVDNDIADLRAQLEFLYANEERRIEIAREAAAWASATFDANNYARGLVDMCAAVANTAPVVAASPILRRKLGAMGRVRIGRLQSARRRGAPLPGQVRLRRRDLMIRKFWSDSFLIWGVVPALFLVAAIWYPFGFAAGGLLEEWDLLYLFDQHGVLWSAFPGQPTSELFAARPLSVLPFALARSIDARSFLGFHAVLMVACVVKVLGGASIGYFLFRNRVCAAALGMLFLVFPADTQQISLRTIHINLAIALMVAGTALALRGMCADRSSSRWAALLLAVLCCLVGAWIYEPALTLYTLLPLLLLARFGFKGVWWLLVRRRKYFATWLAGVLINAAYLYYAIQG